MTQYVHAAEKAVIPAWVEQEDEAERCVKELDGHCDAMRCDGDDEEEG